MMNVLALTRSGCSKPYVPIWDRQAPAATAEKKLVLNVPKVNTTSSCRIMVHFCHMHQQPTEPQTVGALHGPTMTLLLCAVVAMLSFHVPQIEVVCMDLKADHQ